MVADAPEVVTHKLFQALKASTGGKLRVNAKVDSAVPGSGAYTVRHAPSIRPSSSPSPSPTP